MTKLFTEQARKALTVASALPKLSVCASAATALFAIVICAGWYARWTAVLQLLPNSATTKFNTGLCFLLVSVGVLTLHGRFRRIALLPAAITVALAAASLVEFVTSVNLGIDELFAHDYIFSSTDLPGRMSQLAAGCFFLLGVGLALASTGIDRWRLIVVAALACMVAIISTMALLGYLFGIEEAYGWGAYTRMAPHTAAAFLVLSLSTFEWSRHEASTQNFDLLDWLPIVGSVTLMTMIAIVSGVSLNHLESSFDWSRHTYEVLQSAQILVGDIADLQRGARNYVLSGQADALEAYRAGLISTPLQIKALRALTADNARQLIRLDRFSADFADTIAYTRRLIAIRDKEGIEDVVMLEATGEGRRVAARLRADVREFTDEESTLLADRNRIATHNLLNTSRLLVLASVLATLLLVWAHLRGNLELRRRRRAESNLRQISTLQRTILNAANYAIISRSVKQVVTTFNATAEKWLGYSAGEIIGKPAPDTWYDAEEIRARGAALSSELGYPVSGTFETLVARARAGLSEEREWTMVRKDGTRFPVWRSVTAQIDDAGKIAGFVSVITDLTERKQHELELRLSEERFRRAFDDAPIGMALVSPAGGWLKVNRQLCEMLDYSEADLLATDIQALTHRDDQALSAAFIQSTIVGNEPQYQTEKRYCRKDGSIVFAKICVSLVRDADRLPLYFISQIEDISQRVEVDRMKREFMSTVSHELRTPLTSIRGALGLLVAGVLGPFSEKALPMVKIAHQNSERLVRIINDILDLEKIVAGKMEMRIETVPLETFLAEALEASLPYATKHDVSFVLESVAPDASIAAEPNRLMQVMANLLSNAAKFSPAGSVVRVRVRVIDRGMRLRVEVEDRGMGIPASFRARVFEKFAQADSTTSRQFEGTGLGLSITQELIRAMGGSIGFSTVTGQGTVFYFDLPRPGTAWQLALAAQLLESDASRCKVLVYESDSNAPRQRMDKPRILHVEDDGDLCRVIDAALDGKADVVVAPTLQAAEALLRQQAFSLLVLDLDMPDGNGLALLAALPAVAEHPIPVVILSATEVSHDVKMQVDAALVKSRVSEAHIISTVLSLLPQAQSDTDVYKPRQLHC